MTTLKRYVEKRVLQALESHLSRVIPNLVKESLLRNRDKALSRVGFNWALGFELQKHWPDVPVHEGARWLREYIEVPFGTPGYDWSVGAAEEIAAEYAAEFGEPA